MFNKFYLKIIKWCFDNISLQPNVAKNAKYVN